MKITTVRTQSEAMSVVVGMAIKPLELLALTLTSVATRTSAQPSLFVKIVLETIAVSVISVSMGIFARIPTSVRL